METRKACISIPSAFVVGCRHAHRPKCLGRVLRISGFRSFSYDTSIWTILILHLPSVRFEGIVLIHVASPRWASDFGLHRLNHHRDRKRQWKHPSATAMQWLKLRVWDVSIEKMWWEQSNQRLISQGTARKKCNVRDCLYMASKLIRSTSDQAWLLLFLSCPKALCRPHATTNMCIKSIKYKCI